MSRSRSGRPVPANDPGASPDIAVLPAEPPTLPRPRSASGHVLDDDGLPLSGPARARLLAERAAESAQAAPDALPGDVIPN